MKMDDDADSLSEGYLHNMEIGTVSCDGREIYSMFSSNDMRNGILNFSHEISILFTFDGVSCHMVYADEMNCGGTWGYDSDEELEAYHPALLSRLAAYMRDNGYKPRA